MSYGSLEEVLIFFHSSFYLARVGHFRDFKIFKDFMNKIRATQTKNWFRAESNLPSLHFRWIFCASTLPPTVVGNWRFSNPSTIGGLVLLGKMGEPILRLAIIFGRRKHVFLSCFSVKMAMKIMDQLCSRYFLLNLGLFHCHLSYTSVNTSKNVCPESQRLLRC